MDNRTNLRGGASGAKPVTPESGAFNPPRPAAQPGYDPTVGQPHPTLPRVTVRDGSGLISGVPLPNRGTVVDHGGK